MLLADVVATTEKVAATRSRSAKTALLADLLARMDAGELGVGVAYLAGAPRQRRTGVGWRTLEAIDAAPAATATLTLTDVDATLEQLEALTGPGSQTARGDRIAMLLAAATPDEQRYLRALLTGELRQGALAGVALAAIAKAFDVPETEVRRAVMLGGDLAPVAVAAATGGRRALAAFGLELFRPIQPMLAATAADLDDAFDGVERVAVETKLDGARIQVHRDGDRVAVYTRTLRDVTDRLADVVAAVRALPATQLVLDGEALGVGADGRPQPFQDTMARLGTEAGGEADAAEVAAVADAVVLRPFFFDLLHLDGRDLIDARLSERAAELARLVPSEHRVAHLVTSEVAAAADALTAAVADGHEGVMVKTLDAPYAAGRRGKAWRKVKPVHTLDLVVLAAEWGHGRRTGWLSNLHLGARDEATGEFVMLGKTFKGLTDELLAWQTTALLDRATQRDGHVVWVRPEFVVEIALDGVQTSPRYPAGMALRFARVVRYREDKPPEAADTLDTVRAIHRRERIDTT